MKLVISDSDFQQGKILYQYLADLCDVHLVAPSDAIHHANKAQARMFLLRLSSINHFKTFLKEVRSHKSLFDAGIICLTSDESSYKELCSYGADYCLRQADLDEVYWTVFSLKRRLEGFSINDRIAIGPYVIDPQTYEVIQNGQKAKVKPVQIKLLSVFYKHPNRLLTREWLKANIWGADGKITFRSIDAQISKLKKTLPQLNQMIESIYGQGYVFKPDNQKKVS